MTPPQHNTLADPAPALTAPIPGLVRGFFCSLAARSVARGALLPALRQADNERRVGMGSGSPASVKGVLN